MSKLRCHISISLDGCVAGPNQSEENPLGEGGGGYVAAKHAVRVITQTLRLELVAEPLRFTEIAPGMVKTEEFTLKRFQGDQQRYDAVYAGVQEPLVAEDIAEAVRWVASLPAHMNVDELVVRPRAQAAQHKVHRVSEE